MDTRFFKFRFDGIPNLGSYNSSRLVATDMLTGKEYRRLRRKNKKYKNIK